jgi:integral membrane protein (TIGR00529 family)
MLSVLYLSIVVVVIVVLIKFKIDIGAVLFIGAVLTSFLFRIGWKGFFVTLFRTVAGLDTLTLIGTVLLIIYFGALLERRGDFSLLVQGLRALISDSRLTMVIPSSIMGLLPMPGGALMSAPMLKEAARDFDLSKADMTFLNYWFRHIWEYFWPLYPGLIVASTITAVPIFVLARFQFPLTLAAVLAGLVFGLRRIGFKPRIDTTRKTVALKLLSRSIWHIIIIVVLVIVFKVNVLYVMGGICILVTLTTRLKREDWKVVLRNSLAWKTVILLFSVMFFKAVLIHTGAIDSLRLVLSPEGLSLWFLLFIAPFLVGFLTGVNHAYVAVAFPILLPFFFEHGVNLAFIMFAYASGFAGILLSPVHLCLVLTKEYYRADFNPLYKMLIPPVIFVWLVSLVMFFLFK